MTKLDFRMRALSYAWILLLPLLGACEQGAPTTNDNRPPQACTVDGVCDEAAGEDCLSCAPDCCVQCSLLTITPSVPRDYLVSAMIFPESHHDGVTHAVDLDGDGEPDNKAGGITGLFAMNGAAINQHVERRIRDGALLMVLRVYADSLKDDDEVLVRLLPAEVVDATPLFDGGDVVGLRADPADGAYACGVIRDGVLSTDPTRSVFTLPSPMGAIDASNLAVHGVRVTGALDGDQLHDVIVAGGLTREDVNRVLYAELAELLTAELREHPDSEMSALFGALLDGQCAGAQLPGCADAVYGEGECDGTADPPHITATEVRCNELMHAIATPDVDLDRDGHPDHLSIAWRIHAVPVTVLD